MSELKAHNINDLTLYDIANCEFYLKSEADKVIAELKSERDGAMGLNHIGMTLEDYQAAADKLLNHQKYKRCRAMARWCLTGKVYFHYRYDDWVDRGYDRPYKWKKVVFWSKWARRWLKLAEQFKEAK